MAENLSRRLGLAGIACLLLFGLGGCRSSERVAPDGSTITLTASPAVIVLGVGGVQGSPVTVIATVRNSIGVPLKGQDVRFTTTSGDLDPNAGTPVPTDGNGNAMTILTNARVGPTITATSGKVTQPLTLTVATCNLAKIVVSPSPIPVNNCTTPLTIVATAFDTANNTCQGVLIKFAPKPTATPSTDITLSFSPSSAVTDVDGNATVTATLPSDCQAKCGSGNTCTGQIQASDIGGTVPSPLTPISDGVP